MLFGYISAETTCLVLFYYQCFLCELNILRNEVLVYCYIGYENQ